MQNQKSLSLFAVNATASRRFSFRSARKPFLAALVLAVATGLAVADDGGNCNNSKNDHGGGGNNNCNNGNNNNGDNSGTFLPNPVRTVSTVPANGDQNPYGVAFVPDQFRIGSGPLNAGDILVSNFNNAANLQGTGTTIVRLPSNGMPTVFFQGASGLGLTTALGILRHGFVVVGNGPTTDGTSATAQPGSLLVIDSSGNQVQSISNAWINYPWDMALIDRGDFAIAFVANALDGTVNRLSFRVTSTGLQMLNAANIASGYMHQGDPAALFDAPTGLVYDEHRDTLYVASSLDNEVFAVHNAAERKSSAGTGRVIYQDNTHLHGALAMAMAPNGHLLVSNNDVVNSDPTQPSEIVEFTVHGDFVKELSVDPMQGGSFGLAVNTHRNQSTFAAVDDVTGSLLVWTLPADN